MLNVKDFGAVGDGKADDTIPIRNALAAATFRVAVYFPTGTYLVTEGIDISSRKLVGEPPVHEGSGTIVKVARSVEPFAGGVLYALNKLLPCLEKEAIQPVQLTSIQIDANHTAQYGLHLRGASSSILWQVKASHARLDNFLLEGCQLAYFWLLRAWRSQQHGIHMIDCNGASLMNFVSTLSGKPSDTAQPNPNACGLFVENECNSGGVTIDGGDIEQGAGPAIYVKNNVQLYHMPSTIQKVWIENSSPTDIVVLEGTRSVVLQKCRITGGEDGNPNVRAIRLKRGSLNGGAFNNVIRENLILANGQWLSSDGEPGGTAYSTADQIELEDGCINNRIENNLFLRNLAMGVPVIANGRNHIFGQQQVISYAPAMPTSEGWEGDIVFNTKPAAGGFVGWVWVKGPPAGWKPFGEIAS